jgi:LmbE family N-acetylglucosaminyl deacetylase
VISFDLPTPASALAIAAHPDDIEFGAGATLAKWADAGCTVSLLVCTDGSKGTWDANADTDALVVTRQAEQRAAAAALGATGEVVFLGWTDGELESGLRQRAQIASWIRRLRPQVVLGHDPWKRYRLHPDHRHAGLLAVEGVVAARDPHFFPELALAHHRPETLLLFEAEEVDHLETIEGYEAHKLAALEAHHSQFESTMLIAADDHGALESFRDREHARLVAFGALAGVGRAEGFKRIGDL